MTKKLWNELYKDEIIWFGGDLNGDTSKETGGYAAVHSGVGYGKLNDKKKYFNSVIHVGSP